MARPKYIKAFEKPRASRNPTAKKRGWTDWVQPEEKQYFLSCCDCGLVHEMQFRVIYNKHPNFKRNVAHFRVRRADRYTAEHRKLALKQPGTPYLEFLQKGDRVKAVTNNVFVAVLPKIRRRRKTKPAKAVLIQPYSAFT